MKRSEPGTEPCGTPERITDGLEAMNPTQIWKVLEVRNDSIHVRMFPVIPYS